MATSITFEHLVTVNSSEKPAPQKFDLAPSFNLRTWLVRHLYAFVFTLGQLVRSPLNTLATTAVMGIALALPVGLHVLLGNVHTLSQHWDSGAQISLYLATEVADSQAREMAQVLSQRDDVQQVRVITRAQALKEYQELTGFNDLQQTLGQDNPLPPVLIVFPASGYDDVARVGQLAREFSLRPDVDIVQSDLEWLNRLQLIVAILNRGVLIFAGLFAVGVLFIVGNTIRLGIQSRQGEIELQKLIGATDAFIRRPFLYNGVWYGILGGLLGWALIEAGFMLLQGPARELAVLYHSPLRLVGPSFQAVLTLVATGVVLGLVGSWLSVARHLHAIEPS